MSQTKPENAAEATTTQLRAANGKVLDVSRKTTASLADAYGNTLNTLADYQGKFAEQVPVDWIATYARAQAELTRGVARAYSSSARELTK